MIKIWVYAYAENGEQVSCDCIEGLDSLPFAIDVTKDWIRGVCVNSTPAVCRIVGFIVSEETSETLEHVVVSRKRNSIFTAS